MAGEIEILVKNFGARTGNNNRLNPLMERSPGFTTLIGNAVSRTFDIFSRHATKVGMSVA